MSTIAFIGLGIMGAPMSKHLINAGHTVIGFNRSRAPVEQLMSAGGKGANSVAEAVQEADVTITWSRLARCRRAGAGRRRHLCQRATRVDSHRHVVNQA